MGNIFSTLRTDIQIAMRSKLDASWRGKNENMSCAKLYYIAAGKGYLSHNGRRFELVPGNLYLIPPRSGLFYGTQSEIEIWWAHFTADIFSSLDIFDVISCVYEISSAGRKNLKKDTGEMIDCFGSGIAGRQIKAKALLLSILSSFFDATELSSLKHIEDGLSRFQPVFEYIDKRWRERISVGRLARLAKLERAYFSSLFTKTFKISPSVYVRQRKLERAEFMLLNTDTKLSAIAGELGFSDAFHFSRVFKAFKGISPHEFRRRGTSLFP